MTTVPANSALIGRTALLRPDRRNLVVRVVILEVRHMFGRVDCLVRPTDGDGESWVALDQLELIDGIQPPAAA